MKFSKLLLLEASPLVFCTCSFFFLLCMSANTHALFMQRIWLVHARLLVMGKGDTTRWREVAQRVNAFCASTSTQVLIPRAHGKPGTVMRDCKTVASTAKRRWEQGPLQKLRELASLVCVSAHNKENLSQTKWDACTHTYEYTHIIHRQRKKPPLWREVAVYKHGKKAVFSGADSWKLTTQLNSEAVPC